MDRVDSVDKVDEEGWYTFCLVVLGDYRAAVLYCRMGGGELWAEPIPRSLFARMFPIPALRFRTGPRVNARSLRSVGMAS